MHELNSIDANYAKLKCKIQPVDKDSEEYKQIAAFVAGNQEKGRQVLELLDLFVYAAFFRWSL